MEKGLEEMITTKSFSLKIKNKLKIEKFAVKNNMNTSAFLNKMIEDLE